MTTVIDERDASRLPSSCPDSRRNNPVEAHQSGRQKRGAWKTADGGGAKVYGLQRAPSGLVLNPPSRNRLAGTP